MAELAGTAYSECKAGAGNDSGKGVRYSFTIQTNGNYNFTMKVVDSVTCAPGADELIAYTQFGTFSVEGASTTPADSAKVKFVVGSSVMSSPSNVTAYKNFFNDTTNCGTPSLNLVGTASATQTLSGRTCNTYAPFPTHTTSYYNVGTFSASPKKVSININSAQVWYSGDPSAYPTSVNTTFTYQ